LGGLVVTTATGPATFMMGGLNVTQEQRPPAGVIADVRPAALAPTSAADLMLLLLSDGSEAGTLDPSANTRHMDLASVSLGYLADDRSADRVNADREYADQGFASGGQVVAGNAGLAIDPA